MNLYLRYFDDEVLVHTVDEAIEFLCSLREIQMTRDLEEDIRQYVASDIYYPKRYKVRARQYFIIIKTEAANMQDFKDKKALRPRPTAEQKEKLIPPYIARLTEEHLGWYEGEMLFKRVVLDPVSGKHQYIDTTFVARVKAKSGQDCYDRMLDHLTERLDPRCQFPSSKGRNYTYTFLGTCK